MSGNVGVPHHVCSPLVKAFYGVLTDHAEHASGSAQG
jgi:hypothetical protein